MLRHARLAAAAAMVGLVAGCSSAGTTALPTAGPAVSTMNAAATMAAMPSTPPMASGSITDQATSSRLFAPAEFAAVLAQPRTVSIDVHIPFQGKIAGTDLTIPYNEIAQQATKLPADHSTPLAIYCRTGVMSAIAAKTLAGLGYTDVIQLRGGMAAWQSAGRTLLQTP